VIDMAEKKVPGTTLMVVGVGLAATGFFMSLNFASNSIPNVEANGNRAIELLQQITAGWPWPLIAIGILILGILLLGIGIVKWRQYWKR